MSSPRRTASSTFSFRTAVLSCPPSTSTTQTRLFLSARYAIISFYPLQNGQVLKRWKESKEQKVLETTSAFLPSFLPPSPASARPSTIDVRRFQSQLILLFRQGCPPCSLHQEYRHGRRSLDGPELASLRSKLVLISLPRSLRPSQNPSKDAPGLFSTNHQHIYLPSTNITQPYDDDHARRQGGPIV